MVGKGKNLGIYGGLAIDMAFTTKGRLLATCTAPSSLYISDDSAKTWYHAFSNDSLDYDCDTRGWGGGGISVFTNTKGWVASRTASVGGLSAAQISFTNGDTGTWRTAMDGYMLSQLGYANKSVSAIGLSDYYLYVLLQNYIVKIDTNATDSSDVIDITSRISGVDSAFYLRSIAIANTASGYPFYVVIDSTTTATFHGNLYKYDGSIFTKITLPSALSSVSKVFTHPGQSTGDTIFVNGYTSTGKMKLYRSSNAGASWTNISPSTNSLSDYIAHATYNPNWTVQMPLSNGLLLVNGLAYISKDMGSTWIATAPIPQSTGNIYSVALTMHPSDTSFFVGSSTPGVYVSTTGCNGPLVQQPCAGFDASFVWKIARNTNETEFYLATQSGLAYTTKYLDKTITGVNKWLSPNGVFPISNTDVIGGITAVAVDPADSAHVIAAWSGGFFVSHTGLNGFNAVNPTNYDVGAIRTKDIEFVNSTIVVAVTGTFKDQYAGNGDIWRSTNGGDSWANVSPSGFGTSSTVAVGYGKTDTVIYVGSGCSNIEKGFIWKSTDLGLTWTQVNQGPTDVSDPSITGLVINDIAVDPRGKDTLYITAGYDPTRAFAKSTDGGLTYQYINPLSQETPFAVEIDPSHIDSIVYVGINRKLYFYNPALDSASLIYTGLPGDLIQDLAIGSILVGTTTGFYGIDGDDVLITSIPSISSNKDIVVTIYPNPITNRACIQVNGLTSSEKLKITVYDVMGRTVLQAYNAPYSNENILEFDTAQLSNGIYYLHIKNSQINHSQKIIISKM